MQYQDGELLFSPSDLVNYTRSPFISWMDRWATEAPEIKKLKDKPDTMLAHLAGKGYEHEDAFLDVLRAQYQTTTVIDVDNTSKRAQIQATLEAMQCANPIIAQKTGGLTRQVVDHRDGSENGIALDVDFQSLVGSQSVPYIFEDYCSVEATSDAILSLYEMTKSERQKLGKKCLEYVSSEFRHQDTIDQWHETLLSLVENWKKEKPRQWVFEEIGN